MRHFYSQPIFHNAFNGKVRNMIGRILVTVASYRKLQDSVSRTNCRFLKRWAYGTQLYANFSTQIIFGRILATMATYRISALKENGHTKHRFTLNFIGKYDGKPKKNIRRNLATVVIHRPNVPKSYSKTRFSFLRKMDMSHIISS